LGLPDWCELLNAAIGRAEALNPHLNFMAQKHYDYARAAIARGLPKGAFYRRSLAPQGLEHVN
jgi:hypothetical protein